MNRNIDNFYTKWKQLPHNSRDFFLTIAVTKTAMDAVIQGLWKACDYLSISFDHGADSNDLFESQPQNFAKMAVLEINIDKNIPKTDLLPTSRIIRVNCATFVDRNVSVIVCMEFHKLKNFLYSTKPFRDLGLTTDKNRHLYYNFCRYKIKNLESDSSQEVPSPFYELFTCITQICFPDITVNIKKGLDAPPLGDNIHNDTDTDTDSDEGDDKDSEDSKKQGGAVEKIKYNGRLYKLRTGIKGGKFILVRGRKIYQ